MACQVRDLKDFKNTCCAHAAANAHGDANTFGTTAFAFNQGMAGQALTTHTIGMAHSDGTAIHVQQFSGDASLSRQ